MRILFVCKLIHAFPNEYLIDPKEIRENIGEIKCRNLDLKNPKVILSMSNINFNDNNLTKSRLIPCLIFSERRFYQSSYADYFNHFSTSNELRRLPIIHTVEHNNVLLSKPIRIANSDSVNNRVGCSILPASFVAVTYSILHTALRVL